MRYIIMKRLLCAALSAVILAAALCGCGSGGGESSASSAVSSAAAATLDEPVTDTAISTTAGANGNKIHINDSTLDDIWITELRDRKSTRLNSSHAR